MIDLYELFHKIQEKPPLYLGGRSVYQLKAFYDGYTFAKMELGASITAQDDDFEHFHGWLEQRLNARTNLSWAKILEFRSRDEREALDLFFELLDEFINRDKKSEKTKEVKQKSICRLGRGTKPNENTRQMTNKYKPIIPTIVDDFKRSRENFELLSNRDNTKNADWLENSFPITFGGRIDWSKVTASLCLEWSEDLERLSAFEKIATDKQLEGSITIAWGNGLKLPIKTDMKVLRKHSEKIFEEDWDIWICNESDGWCIEVHHDGQVCFGKCMTTRKDL